MEFIVYFGFLIVIYFLHDIAKDVRKLRETNDRIEELYLERNGE